MEDAGREKALAMFRDMEIEFEIVDHPAVFTIEEMRQQRIPHLGNVPKNLFVRDEKKRNYYLVMLRNDKTADLKAVRDQINSKRLSFASEEDLGSILGLTQGEVSPLGVMADSKNAVTVVIDNDLRELGFLGVHPNDNTATVYLAFGDIIKLLHEWGKRIIYVEV